MVLRSALFGYTEAELIGRNVKMLMPRRTPYHEHDMYLARYLAIGVKMIETGREVAGLRSHGTTFPVQLSVGEFEVNGQWMFTGFVHDSIRGVFHDPGTSSRLRAASREYLEGPVPMSAGTDIALAVGCEARR
jgi:hypothetical protein